MNRSICKTEQFTIVNTYTIYSPSYKNLIQSIVEVAAFCWWEKRGFICCSLITKYIPTSRILDEKVKKYLVSISELWSKWAMLLMKTFDGHLHGKPKRRNWALGNKQTKKEHSPLAQLPFLWTLPGMPYTTLKEARKLPAALVSVAGTSRVFHRHATKQLPVFLCNMSLQLKPLINQRCHREKFAKEEDAWFN